MKGLTIALCEIPEKERHLLAPTQGLSKGYVLFSPVFPADNGGIRCAQSFEEVKAFADFWIEQKRYLHNGEIVSGSTDVSTIDLYSDLYSSHNVFQGTPEKNWQCEVLKSIIFETFVGGSGELFPAKGYTHSILKTVMAYYQTFEPDVPTSDIPLHDTIPDGCFHLAGTLVCITTNLRRFCAYNSQARWHLDQRRVTGQYSKITLQGRVYHPILVELVETMKQDFQDTEKKAVWENYKACLAEE